MNRRRTFTWLLAAGLAITGFSVSAHADEERERERTRNVSQKILRGLRGGIEALRALGLGEEARRLEEIAAGVPRRKDGAQPEGRSNPRTEHELALEHRRIMKLAVKGLEEAKRSEAAEQMELAVRAFEILLERNRGPEAQRIRRTAPSLGQQVELLVLASRATYPLTDAS